MIRVVLPHHLRTLAAAGPEVVLTVPGPATPGSVLDALETLYPVLRGTIRDPGTRRRRPMLRFYACDADWSDAPDEPLPAAVAAGVEPLWVIGAVSGGS